MMRRPTSPARWLAERAYAAACLVVIAACAAHALHSTFPVIPTVLP